MPDDSQHQVNLLDLLALLIRWRVFITASVLSVTLAVVVITLVVTPRYRSMAAVRAQESSGQSIPSLIASKLGSLGGLAGLAPSLGEIPEEMYISILKSRWMSERVIDHFDLRNVYRMKTARIEEVIQALQGNVDFDLDDMASILLIRVEDKNASRAREMAEYYVDQLDSRNQELRSLAAHKEREFIGQRLTDERANLTALEDSLSSFQLATGVLDIQEQTKAAIQAAANLEAQRILTRTELEMNKQVWGSLNPETEFTRLKLASIDSTLQLLIHGHQAPNKFMVGLEEIPKTGLTYVRLMRDIEIQQLLVGFLLQQFEQARISELRNTPTLMRIDMPVEATKRAWPRRSLMVIVAFGGSFVFASAIALFLEMLGTAVANPLHPQHDHIQNVLRSWQNGSRARKE